MAKIKVDFTLTKSKDSLERVAIEAEGRETPVKFEKGKATKMLEADTYHVILWHFTGAHDDEMKIGWTARGLTGTAAQDKLDRNTDRPFPGGKLLSSGASVLQTPKAS